MKQHPRRVARRAAAACAIATVLGVAACGSPPQLASTRVPKLSEGQIVAKARSGVVQILGKEGDNLVGGTGFVIDQQKGLIVTNAHVFDGATQLSARLAGGGRYPVHVFASRPCEDVGILQFTRMPDSVSALPLGDSSRLQPGDDVFTIGFPGTVQQLWRASMTATAGTVANPHLNSGKISDAMPTYHSLVEVNASINPGNSGGPLLDSDGAVVGITTLHNPGSAEQPVDGQGYAISINYVESMLGDMLQGHSVANVGWDLQPLDELSVPDLFAADPDYSSLGGKELGTIVAGILHRHHVRGLFNWGASTGSPADHAGLGYGRLIERIDGTAVDSVGQACDAIEGKSPGDVVQVTGEYLTAGTTIDDVFTPFADRIHLR
jgi:S1-C subfamily serine protease